MFLITSDRILWQSQIDLDLLDLDSVDPLFIEEENICAFALWATVMSGAIDGIRPISPAEGATAKMAQASSLFAPEDETNGDVEMINISHKVSQSVVDS